MSELRNRLVRASRASGEFIRRIREHPGMDYAQIYGCLRGYILTKYMLEECDSDVVLELARMSVIRMLGMTREDAVRLDMPGCTGADSAHDKKTLLIAKLEKELGVDIHSLTGGDELTVRKLAEIIHGALGGGGTDG